MHYVCNFYVFMHCRIGLEKSYSRWLRKQRSESLSSLAKLRRNCNCFQLSDFYLLFLLISSDNTRPIERNKSQKLVVTLKYNYFSDENFLRCQTCSVKIHNLKPFNDFIVESLKTENMHFLFLETIS